MLRTASLLLAACAAAAVASARPEFHAKFLSDPYRLQAVEGCVTCHDNPEGGGPRNEFGTAFDQSDRNITPILRAQFPDRFGFYSTRLADGSAFHFSDPENQLVVFERNDERYAIDLLALTAKPEEVLPPPANRMSFFVTSTGPGNGAHFEGLAGADQHCQWLAEAVGASDQTWRAYLSTSYGGKPAINAGDRIGAGPWFNANGVLIARGPSDLHRAPLRPSLVLNEKGEAVSGDDDASHRDVLTGSHPDGTAAIGGNCNNWTSATEGVAVVGHVADRWNSAHETAGCSPADVGDALFYCFAR